MEIILVGCGKVGAALARQLSEEGHSVTLVDTNADKLNKLVEAYDVMGIVGNGSSISVLTEAGLETADVLIAVTGSDELNLLCCMFAKKAGHCHAIARVRNPAYSHELDFINSWAFPASSIRNWPPRARCRGCCGSRPRARSTPLRMGACG